MQKVSLIMAQSFVLLKIGMYKEAGAKTGQALQKIMDLRLVDYGIDVQEE